ncbi:MAG: hypothetical protein ACFUZC_04865 [Chthoniobacteraceae bacterium]
MKRLELPNNPDVLTLCYKPGEIALACRLKTPVILAEIKAGRLGPVYKPCATQILVPGPAVNAWLSKARMNADCEWDAPDFLELHYTPGQVALMCSLNKEAVLAEIAAGRLAPAFKPFENRIFVPASAVSRWLQAACISPA